MINMHYFELPYISVDDSKIQVTTEVKDIDFKGQMAVIHNVGPDTCYYSGKGVVSSDSPELAPGEKTFPRTGKLKMVSAGTSTIKIEYVDIIG
jgi:hypothetical protein